MMTGTLDYYQDDKAYLKSCTSDRTLNINGNYCINTI